MEAISGIYFGYWSTNVMNTLEGGIGDAFITIHRAKGSIVSLKYVLFGFW